MKNLKKVLALVMAFTIAFTVMAGAAFTDAADIQQVEAVNMLTALNVIEGEPDGSFNPSGTVTRAQMAKMIYVVMSGGETNADTYSTMNTTFTDINGHWAAGFIKFCQTNGIIAGKSATQFDPDAEVTGTEAAKMLLVVMGYEPARAKLTGTGWDSNTIALATQAGLLKNVNATLTEGLPRQYAAQIIYNTLDAWRVKWSNDSGTFDYFADVGGGNTKETVGYKYMKLTKDIGTLTNISGDTLDINISAADDPDSVHNAGSVTFTKVKEDYTSLLGERVKVLTRDTKTNEVLGVYAMEDNVSYTVNASDVEDDDVKIKFGGKSYSMKLISGANNQIRVLKTNLNGALTSTNVTSAYFNDLKQSSNTFKFVDTDGDGKLDTAIETAYTAAEVTYASSSQIIAGATYKYDDEHISEDIAKDDWAVISYNRFLDCKEIAKADITKAKLTGKKTDTRNDKRTVFDVYQIDSTWHNASRNAEANGTGNENLKSVKAGDNVEAAIVNGVVYHIKRTSDSANSITDVAMILNVAASNAIGGKQVKLLFFDGTTKVVDFDSDAKSGNYTYAQIQGMQGRVVEYEVSSDKYSFKNSISAETDYYGDYTYEGAHNYTVTATGGADSINNIKIADSAKVLLYSTADQDYKTLTGKQLKSLNTTDLEASVPTQIFRGDMDGLKQLGAISVVTGKPLPTNIQTKDNYAYLLSDAYHTQSTNKMTYTIWTGSEEVTVEETGSKLSDRKKGTVIGYRELKGDEDVKTIEDVAKITMTPTAVDSVNSRGTTFTVIDGIGSAMKKQFDVGNNSTVLYVDSDDAKGVESGVIREASKNASGAYIQNVLAYSDGTDDIEVLIVDIKNKIVKNPYMAAEAAANATIDPLPSVANIAGIASMSMTYATTSNPTENAVGKTLDKDTVLTLNLTNGATAGYKTNIKVDGAKITSVGTDVAKVDDNNATFTSNGVANTVTLVVDGSSSYVTIELEQTNVQITTAADDAVTAATGASGTYKTKSYVNNRNVAGGTATMVDIGDTFSMVIAVDTLTAQTEKVTMKADTTEIGSATFAPTTAAQELKHVVTKADDGATIALSSEKVAALAAPKFTAADVKLLDQYGKLTNKLADVVAFEVTFDQVMNKALVETKGNWTFTDNATASTAITIDTVKLDETGKVATVTLTSGSDPVLVDDSLATTANIKSADGVAAAVQTITWNASGVISVATTP